jgi:signal transduction histidine kinase
VASPGPPPQALDTLAPFLERTGNHLASMASAARASSPHEAGRAAQLAGVAVRLAQAARRIRLLREISLIYAGRLAGSLRPEQFDYAELVRSAGERMRPLFTAVGVDLAVEAPQEKLPVRVDRERMELALRDLLEVGLAMTSAGGRVTVRAGAGGGEVEASVTDTGCGMSRAELDGLFSAEGKPPVQEAYTGGVRDGLYVAKEIIEASGGQLWAESSPGRGTRFSLRLPLA